MINSLFQSKDWIDWKKWQNYLNSASLLKCCSWVLPSCISPLCLLSVKGLEWQITAGQSSSVYNMNLYIVISWYYNTNVRLIISWSYISVLCYKQIPIHQSDIHAVFKSNTFYKRRWAKIDKKSSKCWATPTDWTKTNVSILYPQKTLENLCFFVFLCAFRKDKMETLAWNGLKWHGFKDSMLTEDTYLGPCLTYVMKTFNKNS